MTEFAAVTDEAGGIHTFEIEVPAPSANEVAIDIHASGVCHTDHDLRRTADMILGHEGAGIVAAVGPGITSVAVGDRVVLNWAMPCGRCFQCVEGNEHLCEVGSPLFGGAGSRARDDATAAGRPLRRAFGLGTLATRTVVPERAVTKLPDYVGYAAAAITGCGVMTGVGSVINTAEVKAGTTVVVLGCGGVGLNVVQGARIVGAARIIAVDTREDRLLLARQFGATETMQADPTDTGLFKLAERVRASCGGRGADYAFECTAIPELGAAPLAMIRHGGMAIQVSGIEQTIEVDMSLFEFDKTYVNPLYGQCRPSRDFPRLFSLYENGSLLLDELVTQTYTLDEVQRAFDDLLAGSNAKGVVMLR